MSKHKYTNVVCIAVVIAMLAVTVVFLYSPNLGVTVAHAQAGYVDSLFSTDKVHTIDIQVSDSNWDEMIENAQAEEYIQATVVIDGEKVGGVGLRPKGNSSLSMIASSDSDRYSFKIEFDHFSDSISYHGLDKLALNNIAQDNTYMKDYVTYQMMNAMGADAPLSSFIWVTVNGEDWGLYIAAECIEESFAQRVYGNDFGEIYKPDSMDMNGGGFGGGENGEMPQMPEFDAENGEMPDFGQFQDGADGQIPDMGGGRGGFGGSSETSLIYTDDDPESYSAIFDGAVFKTSDADKTRLIESLKQLNEGENIDEVVDVDEVIRYFVVHNFVLNSDSYTGNMVHNYYLAEDDGKLSMIAWDYNLAFGGMGAMGRGMGGMFGGGGNAAQTATDGTTTTDQATTLVNYPIDSPMLSGTTEDKPMIAWIWGNEEYLEKYHEVYAEYMEYFSSGRFAEMYDNAIALISPYVEKDPTAFCTYEDFQKGSSALREFCLLRAESIGKQLNGTIAATSDGQTAANNAGFVDASGIDIESMGSNSMGFGRARGGGQFPGWGENTGNTENDTTEGAEESATEQPVIPESGESLTPPDGTAAFPGSGDFAPPDGQVNPPVDGNLPQTNADAGVASATQESTEQDTVNNPVRTFRTANVRSSDGATTPALSAENIILLSACVVVLIGGILFAKKRRA
jgi:spore coat protein CotH